ncbi:tryptophan synthase beta subunit-like PLP-dependent enzyme [Backusella circina FSU 941]|nr:tryptophan synthase beta subunit-like PLP-dependent enzyme [Backusella circina FSU 941]
MLPPVTRCVSDNVGNTPMLALEPQNNVEIFAKLEFYNPTGSGKDRLAKFLLQELERKNPFHQENKKTLIIPTTGNLGISLATLAAPKYRVICILPERTTNDRIALLKALGVEILRSPNEAKPEAPESAYSVATKLAEQLADAIVMDETKLYDPSAYHDLADEILQQQTETDYVFVGVESGVTLTGIAQYLKKKSPNVKIIGVEPTDSVFSGSGNTHSRGDWLVEDIGNTFIPKSLDTSLVDEWVKVSDKEAFSMARRLIRDKGLLCGPSSGAVMAAAMRHTPQNSKAVVILDDSAKNYTSTLLSDDWMFENDLADDLMTKELEYLSQNRYRAASVEDLQLPAAVTIAPTATAAHALDLMLEREYSQLPVIKNDNKKLVGYISLASLQERLERGTCQFSDSIEQCMFSFKKNSGNMEKYHVITPDTSLADLAKFFEKNSFAVVTDINRKWCLGVATKYDLISFLHRRQFL